MSLPINYLLEINEKTILTDFNKIELNKIPIYIISKISKKLVGIFFISLKNLNKELSLFIEKIENKNLIEFKMDFENKEIIKEYLTESNDNEIENENFYEENSIEEEVFLKENKIKVDKIIKKIIIKENKINKKIIKSFIPSFFILSLDSLIKEYTETMRIRGTISSSITLDAFESADNITFQRNLSELQQHTFIDPEIIENKLEDYKEVNNYILKEKLHLLNLEEKGTYFLNLLSDAQNEKLFINQEIEFEDILITF